MKVLVIGGGGREHALVWKIKKSPLVKKVFCCPGNAGISREARCVPIAADRPQELLQFAVKEKIDLTVVGPEVPLVMGIVDLFTDNGLKIFGPTRRAAELEGSKAFAKHLMAHYHIPTAAYEVFDDLHKAKEFVNGRQGPLVVKADGLAAGKGVIVCPERLMAHEALEQLMAKNAFGEGGRRVVIEECLSGEEVSVLALSDGENVLTMLPAQDHKRILDGDQGPNTGGMGAYAPCPFVSEALMTCMKRDILEPTIRGMALEGRPYKGVLYAGIMLTADGPKVLEYNCRFGDPETQVVLPLIKGDLVEAMLAAMDGRLAEVQWRHYASSAVTVVLASGGYPENYQTGQVILGSEGPFARDVKVFHAGTRLVDGRCVSAGGRVLSVTALAPKLPQAIDKAYTAVGKITFDGAYYRKDIGAKGLAYL